MGRLNGKVAIVTGASQGMGAATARLFAEEGAKVIIADIKEAEGRALAEEIGANALFARVDITVENDWIRAVELARDSFGSVDALVNNAAIVEYKTIAEETLEGFERTMRINVAGAFLGIKHVAPVMAKGGKGSIINISSAEGMRGTNGMSAYTASKWGVRGFTKAAAMELGRSGIRVNSVHPGPTNTPMVTFFGDFEGSVNDLELFKPMLSRQPINRFAEPIEVARVSLFLASDESSFVTGAEIAADGGMSVGTYSEQAPTAD
uniref:Short-chain dehydrogenase/reductase SDR n=1 Tax=Sphingomonas sp. JE1 TaxID=1628059 RepID=A0A0D5A070_9SPHN|nr:MULTISPECIES: glucose 1-dehydrogenase [unclassified Sphingomonas]AJW29578.1 short-chain dehydrogenase/reductase SDR [Sphingomonas sp. JE1]